MTKFTKKLLVMKLTILLLTVAICSARATTVAQTVTVSGRDLTLRQVFATIKQQTGYVFFYKKEFLNDTMRVTLTVRDMPLQQLLDLILKDLPVDYTIQDRTIILSRRPRPAAIEVLTSAMTDEASAYYPVNGMVRNAEGEPLWGATVRIKGSVKGVRTNASGLFTIDAVKGQILVISFTGYKEQEVLIGSTGFLQVRLLVSDNKLDELQVIAYGTTTRRLTTGNVSTVRAETIAKQPVNNPLLALQGRIPGVYVEQSSGLSGSNVKVRIQGTNSIANGNDPFYVIDGVPYSSTSLPTLSYILGNTGVPNAGAGSPLAFINPDDIESIDVLKDADATAIYGSRAANGAILITTKRGKPGPGKVDVNLRTGWGKVGKSMPLLNTRQYLDMRYEAFRNDNIDWTGPSVTAYDLKVWDTTRYTDWQKKLIGGTARWTDLSASLSGGTGLTQFNLGTTYHRETTVFPGDLADTRAAVSFGLTHASASRRLKVDFSANYFEGNNQLTGNDLTRYAMETPPVAPALYNSDGSVNWGNNASGASTFDSNPIRFLANTYRYKTGNLIANANISYTILPGLALRSSFGYSKTTGNEVLKTPLYAIPTGYSNRVRQGDYSNKQSGSWIVEPQLTYRKKIAAGTMELMAGTTFQRTTSNVMGIRGLGFNSDKELDNFRAAATITGIQSLVSQYNYNAVYGRINYNIQNRYIVNAAVRRDGSRRFGPENVFSNFYSVGAAWILSEEKFLKEHAGFISFAKLKGSYGTTGSDQIGDYQFLQLYSPQSAPVAYQGVTGNAVTGIANPYLQWEENRKINMGMDLSFFNRLDLGVNYFTNQSGNQLVSMVLPMTAGFQGVAVNRPAKVRNNGWEIVLGADVLNGRGLQWKSSFNISIQSNKLLSFPGLATSAYVNSLVIGQPITMRKGLDYAGVNPKTGLYRFINAKGELTSSPVGADSKIPFNMDPRYFGGWQNTFIWKNFNLDFLFQFVRQTGVNYTTGTSIPGAMKNQPARVMDRWNKEDDLTPIQLFSTTSLPAVSSFSAALTSSAVIRDASFIRLKNISLYYSLPQQWMKAAKIQQVRLFAQGQNLWTITDYIGLDPESRSSLSLPPLKIITVGINCTF